MPMNQFQIIKKLLVFCVLLTMCSNTGNACSCSLPSFCTILEFGSNQAVFKGRVLEVNYPDTYYRSVIVEVITEFSENPELTDTIELIGGYNTAGCEMSLGLFNEGDIKYMAINKSNTNLIDLSTIPPANENYWRHSTNSCETIVLDIVDDRVEGFISKEFSYYPSDLFDEKIKGCNLTGEDIAEGSCADFFLYPNPIIGQEIFIEDRTIVSALESIRIFTPDGKLIFEEKKGEIARTIELPFIKEKLVIVEVICGEERIIQKMVVMH